MNRMLEIRWNGKMKWQVKNIIPQPNELRFEPGTSICNQLSDPGLDQHEIVKNFVALSLRS